MLQDFKAFVDMTVTNDNLSHTLKDRKFVHSPAEVQTHG